MIFVNIAGDDPLARAGLRAMLEGEPSLVVLPDEDVDDAVAGESHHGGMVVVIQGGGTLALVSDDAAARDALADGAQGVLDRTSLDTPVLLAAIRAVAEGLTVVDPAFRAMLDGPEPMARAVASDAASDAVDPLTPRELEVLSLLAEGLSNKAIAARLAMSEHTAKFHVNAILAKLGASTRTEAVVKATRRGLLAL